MAPAALSGKAGERGKTCLEPSLCDLVSDGQIFFFIPLIVRPMSDQCRVNRFHDNEETYLSREYGQSEELSWVFVILE